ncbi:translation initiation factor IF-2 subunit gamma [Candidatus Pacearchaeota archaeon]|nr:translation initiation factor IF-2 subunit gamma [Candidatus Pacearchaeota archaeon]
MTKTKLELPELNIGVVGHIDHGKTTLLSRLTGKFADTHSEELKRGITIKLGYADMTIYEDNGNFNISKKGNPKRYVSFIDAPGHEMLMATMLSGASTMDAAILVIAANEGIKPQTKEHLMALQSKGIREIIVVQNKIDIVDKKQALENYKEIKEFLQENSVKDSPIIPISAQQSINIDKLLEEICKLKIPERDTTSAPIFLIARSFDINRPGSEIPNLKGGVFGGILKKGILKVGDEIEIKPGRKITKSQNQSEYKTLKTKILSLYKGAQKVQEVTPGASISIETALDPNMTKTDILTGCVASTTSSKILPEITYKLKLKTNLFEKILGISNNSNNNSENGKQKKQIEEIKTKEMLMLSVNTTITIGIVESVKENEIILNLTIPVIALPEDNVGLARRIDNHWRLIGWGEVIE